MNKKLIALAVAAAIAPAAAMADSGNVSIYGVAHLSLDHNNYGTGGENNTRLSSNSSRLGFKGTEDLGNGLSAVWQMETGIDMDARTPAGGTATNTTFGERNTYLGLSSKTMGTVLFGKHDTPYKLATGKLDIMADTVGDYNGIVAQVNGTNLFDSRLGNVSAYISPTWSGFHFAAAVVAANETSSTATNDPKAYSLMGMYDNGPFFASLAREKASETTGVANSQSGLPQTGSGNDAAATKLGLGYNANNLLVGLVYEKITTSSGIAAGAERKAWWLPIQYTMGNNAIKFGYGKADTTTGGNDNGAKMVALGAYHNFSKRTEVYAIYAKMDNGANGNYALGLAGTGHGQSIAPAAAGSDPSSLSVGMKHSF